MNKYLTSTAKPSEHLDSKFWEHQKMSPEFDFEWPDLCPVGIMSISETKVITQEGLTLGQGLLLEVIFPRECGEWVRTCVGCSEKGLRFLSSNTPRAEAVACLEYQSLTLFCVDVMREVKKLHAFSESNTLEQKGLTESRAFEVH